MSSTGPISRKLMPGRITVRATSSVTRVSPAVARPAEILYAGFSLGVMAAQSLAQTRPGARGAILYSAAMPASEFGGSWPEGVPLQIHMMDADPWGEEDRPVAEALVEEVADAQLFLYPGSGHLFADESLGDYDEQAADLLQERTLAFLERVG